MDVTAVLESKDDTGTTWRFFATSKDNVGGNLLMGNGTLTFDNTGALTASTGTSITIDRSGTGALPDLTIDLDFSGIAALSTSTTSTNASIIKEGEADGSPIGSLQGFSVGADGTITGAYSNGLHRTLGQIAVAKFNNPQGLNDEGGNLYSSGPNSGLPVIGPPTTLGLGKIRENALELSNVDLSNEFINLIVASTGFTAASRVITTSDQLLTELLNTNR
jgi:flagellar hook protein FlgE